VPAAADAEATAAAPTAAATTATSPAVADPASTALTYSSLGLEGPQLHRALAAAAGLPSLPDLSALLDAGANPAFTDSNALGWSALCRAAWAGRGANVGRLLRDPRTDVDVVDAQDRTPLFLAALGGHHAVVAALLAAGADCRTRGTSPLLAAAAVGAGPVVAQLLAAGCRPDARDAAGDTPLHAAAREGHADVVAALLAAGAAPGARNRAGETPEQLAAAFEHEDVLAVLAGAAAEPAPAN
jgi:ankyrin repeat protein